MREVPFISDWIKEAEEEGVRRGFLQGQQEGKQEGKQEGYVQARREDIISLLDDKFGVVKKSILEHLDKVDRVESLKMLLKRVSKAETQEEFLDLIKIAVGE